MDDIDFIQPKKIVGKLISIDELDKIRAEIAELGHYYPMGHGLAVYKDGAKLIDVLFIETDKDKIDAFDPLEEQEQEVENGNDD